MYTHIGTCAVSHSFSYKFFLQERQDVPTKQGACSPPIHVNCTALPRSKFMFQLLPVLSSLRNAIPTYKFQMDATWARRCLSIQEKIEEDLADLQFKGAYEVVAVFVFLHFGFKEPAISSNCNEFTSGPSALVFCHANANAYGSLSFGSISIQPSKHQASIQARPTNRAN